MALQALINPGDEVLIPDPGFVCYELGAHMAGGIPVSIPLLEKDGFSPDIASVISQITGKSLIIVINSPNNPTGSVLSYEDLSRIARVIEERDLLVISDEVYEKIAYDGTRHYCLAGHA